MSGAASSNFCLADTLAAKAPLSGIFDSQSRLRGVSPTPLPCFLEVLILRDFKSFAPEVLK
jgi:hypothetical protein